MQALKKPTRWARWEEEDDGELPELPWKKATSCAAPPDLDDENHAQAAYKAPVSASPPMMKPKSYATVAKASVVAAAPPPARGGSQATRRSFDAIGRPQALRHSLQARSGQGDACTWHVHKCATCAAPKLLLHVDHTHTHTGT